MKFELLSPVASLTNQPSNFYSNFFCQNGSRNTEHESWTFYKFNEISRHLFDHFYFIPFNWIFCVHFIVFDVSERASFVIELF